MVNVRFAPSPTGYLHIGGARTCLFSWLYARCNNGRFILRVEDTDKIRSRQEYVDEILESISWLGMDWDDIFYQSQRFDLYRQHAQKLIDAGAAYEKEGAVFFKYNFERIEIDDLIRGKIVFNELPKEEEVIIKSDASPTYNFSCVVDDALMQITHIIRGEDHISNTPKQILMYKALGFKVPFFAHVPLILSPEGGRMSKRYGATSIREYRRRGYLAQALVNYFLLLGWSAGEARDIISLTEAKSIFDIKDVNKTAASFSLPRLDWINGEYIRRQTPETLLSLLKEHLKEENFFPPGVDDAHLIKVVSLLRERMVTLADFSARSRFCFYDDYEYSSDAADILADNISNPMTILGDRLAALDVFSASEIEKEFRATAQNLGLKAKVLVHPTRLALTGSKTGPGLFETMEVLGKKEVVKRIRRLLDYWEGDKK